MRGHIVKRYKDSYTIVLNLGVDPATGKRKQQWITVKGTKKEAEKRLAESLHQLDKGVFTKPGKTTLADYLKQWLKDCCWANLAPRTAEGYESIVHCHLIPSLGQIPLTQLKPEHLQHVYSEKLAVGLSHRTVRYIHVTLHKALQDAARLGIIVRNPADAVEPPKVQRHEMRTMNESDIHIFLEFAKSTPYYALFYLALFTGMRRSELLALRWSCRPNIIPVIGYSCITPPPGRQSDIQAAQDCQGTPVNIPLTIYYHCIERTSRAAGENEADAWLNAYRR